MQRERQGTGNMGQEAAQMTETLKPGDEGRREFRRCGDNEPAISERDGFIIILSSCHKSRSASNVQ